MVSPEEDNKSIVTRLRGSRRALAVVLILACLSGVVVAQSMSDQNLTQYAVNDPGNNLQVTSDRIQVSNLPEDTNAFVERGSNIEGTNVTRLHYSFEVTESFDTNELYGDAQTGFGGSDGDVLTFVDRDFGSDALSFQVRNSSGSGGFVTLIENGERYHATIELDSIDQQVTARLYNDSSRSDLFASRSVPYDSSNDFHTIIAFEQVSGTSYNQEISGNWSDYSFGTERAPRILGEITDENGDPIENATVTISENGTEVTSINTDQFGGYEVAIEPGTYNVTANKDGYFPRTEIVMAEGGDITQDFTLVNKSAALTIDTAPFLEHGDFSPYEVTFRNITRDGGARRVDVTDEATITSNDTGIVTVDRFNQEIVATSDTSVNNRTYITAEYSTGGETYTTQQNVTVANATVDNLGILPPVQRFTASLSGGTDANPNDKTIMLLIIGTAAGAAASLIATSFAGVAALTMVMMLGWIMGMLGDGMAMVTIFIALFVGLNVAGNVDYTVRR